MLPRTLVVVMLFMPSIMRAMELSQSKVPGPYA